MLCVSFFLYAFWDIFHFSLRIKKQRSFLSFSFSLFLICGCWLILLGCSVFDVTESVVKTEKEKWEIVFGLGAVSSEQ